MTCDTASLKEAFQDESNCFPSSPLSQADLEDLAFSVLHPEEYEQVRRMVGSRQDTHALEATVQAIKAGLDERCVIRGGARDT